jgi:hypothetical protein
MSHRPARINPDSLPVLVVAVVVTALLALVSFLMSYAGLSAAAEWANVPAWLAWGVPAYIDGGILVYTIAALVHRAREEGARMSWASLGIFATLSVAANAVHAWDAAPAELRTGIGMLIAGLAPVAVLLTTHTIARLIIAPPSAEEAPAVAPITLWRERRADVLTVKPSAHAAGDAPVDHLAPARKPSRPSAKSTAARDARIRELAASGTLGVRDIGEAVGVSKSTVSRVLKASTTASAPALASVVA